MPTEVREYRAGVCILSLILGLLTDFIVQPVEGALDDLLYELAVKLARQKSERRSSAALRWKAAFAAKYSSGLGGYKQPVMSISVYLSAALSEQRVADGLDGFQLLVATVSIRSMTPNDCPTMNAIPATHSAESINHSQNSPRAARNAMWRKPVVQSKSALQHCSVMAL